MDNERIFPIFVFLVLIISGTTTIIYRANTINDSYNFPVVLGETEWLEPVFMPRDEECIDETNGQVYPEYGIGYEPSLSLDSKGNMFVTAHKDLRPMFQS